ncbi:MAG: YitT family protein, partial [Eubacteriales bacterium]
MVKTSIREHLTDAVIIIAGCAIYALGLVIFLEPNNIAPGGVSGIALIINFIFPSASVGVLIIVLNIPLFLAGWKFEGKP